MSTQNHSQAGLRSSLAHAAFAVEERVVWGGSDALRSVADAAKWPFERIAWALERGLIWPLEERTGDWSGPLRVAGVAAFAVLAVGAGVLGLAWASSGGDAVNQTQAEAPIAAPVVKQAPQEKQAATVLHGATPDFTPANAGSASKATGDTATTKTSAAAPGASQEAAHAGAPADTSSASTSSATAAGASPAGPAALEVAHHFAGAFVLYETGRTDTKVRTAFATTATPELAHSLLRRPPRLPANAKVPQAKVLNVVPGPQHAGTYTLSVSLLRVGITSELRLEMRHDRKSGEWQVTDVLG